MMEKKRMAALLAAVLFGMSAIPAGAVNLIDTDAAATDSAEHAELDLYGVRATVTDRQDGELTVSTETAGTVVVHIAEQTIIMDTQTGLPAGAQDIKKDDEVYLYCGEMMALSEPPQAVIVPSSTAAAKIFFIISKSFINNMIHSKYAPNGNTAVRTADSRKVCPITPAG